MKRLKERLESGVMHHGRLLWMGEPSSLFSRTARAIPSSRRRQASGSAHTCTKEDVFQECVVY